MMKYMVIVLLSISFSLSLRGQESNYGIVEKPGNVIPAGIMVTDEDSARVELKSLIDRPVLLAFVYYRCPGLCGPLMSGVAEVMDKCTLEPGKDYKVICLSFNPSERPSLATAKKRNELKNMHRRIPSSAWRFLTADSVTIAKLTGLAGFEFRKAGDAYIHEATLIVLSPSGKITQYLLGTAFLPREVEWAVNNARTENAVASRIKDENFCYPSTPQPRLTTSVTVIGGAVIFLLAELLFFLVTRRRKMKVQKTGSQGQ